MQNLKQLLLILTNIFLQPCFASITSLISSAETFEQSMFEYQPTNDKLFSRIISNLTDYGCWCNFKDFSDNKIHHSNASPVDQFDALCQTLINGYSCGRIDVKSLQVEDDSSLTSNSGSPGDDLYSSSYSFGFGDYGGDDYGGYGFDLGLGLDLGLGGDSDDTGDGDSSSDNSSNNNADYSNDQVLVHHASNDPIICDPAIINYNTGLDTEAILMINMMGDPYQTIERTCKFNNPTNECARVACILEGNFIYDIFLLWSNSEYKITTSEQFLKGNFDKKETCRHEGNLQTQALGSDEEHANFGVAGSGVYVNSDGVLTKPDVDYPPAANGQLSPSVPNNPASPSQPGSANSLVAEPKITHHFCCGKFPKRTPFRQNNHLSRACCGEKKTFNRDTSQCCSVSGSYKVQTVCDIL